MTVFSLRGSKIETDLNGQITGVQDTNLEAITRIGTNSLDVAYLGDPQNPLSISLSDYNLKFDKVHINDGDLPAQIEYFDFVSDNTSVRVINFVFETENGMEERMFSVGLSPLPNFASPSEASLYFAQHEPVKITSQDDWTIQLAQIENIETSGVFVNLDQLNTENVQDADGFDFVDMEAASDIETWDIEFADAAQHEDAIAATLNSTEDTTEAVSEWMGDPDAPADVPNSVELDAG